MTHLSPDTARSSLLAAPRGIIALAAAAALLTVASLRTPVPATPGPPPIGTGSPVALERQVRNLEAFARLYGWVRWFHPSDEASAIDWDRFAVLGAERVRDVADDTSLRAVLDGLFLPIAPTVRLHAPGERPEDLSPAPPPASQWKTIAWQHLGMGQGQPPYLSARLNRPRRESRSEMAAGFGTIAQAVPATELRGKRVRLRAAVRAEVEGEGNQAQVWLRVDRPGGTMGFFDNMQDRPIRTPRWAEHEIVGEVAEDAERVVFGCFLTGRGSVWVDAVELAVEAGGEWRTVPIANGDFEAGEEPTGWRAQAPGYVFEVEREAPFAGRSALRIHDDSVERDEPLFAAAPALGDAHEGELVRGLLAHVPLAVPGDEKSTWPPASPDLARLQAELAAIDPARWSGDDWRVRVAAAVIAWNAFQHFYPYFDVVSVDWGAELPKTILGALTASDRRESLDSLRALVAAAQDGHGSVFDPSLGKDHAALPAALDVVEGKVVVVTPEGESPLRRGDVLLEIDGEDVDALLDAAVEARSGSPQWRRHSALWGLGVGPVSQPARVRVERDGETRELTVTRGQAPDPRRDLEPAAELGEGVLYVDLTRLEREALQGELRRLPGFRAVIFDMRGYPSGGAEAALQHLTDTPLQSAIWQVPQVIHPDHAAPAGWDTSGRWTLPPAEPRFRGKVAFLTGPLAISYAESVMGVVEAYGLGEIVGSTTAGTNGNINRVSLPGGYRLIFTGMRVLKHDGSRHHLVGIAPTVPVKRTLAGFRAGRDEELEAALRVVGAASP